MNGKPAQKDGHEIIADMLGREVVFTADRANRPHDFSRERQIKKQNPHDCFFCPGNESLTPPQIDHVPFENIKEKSKNPLESYWAVRCFENKFPAVRQIWKNAYGYHEIIVETPRHDLTVSELNVLNWTEFLKTAGSRMKAHMKDKKIKYTILFKNEGRDAGASLEHTHSQIVSLPFVPSMIQKYAKTHKAAIAKNLKAKENIAYENKDFTVFCPQTAQFHFETWIAPKKHTPSIENMSANEYALLADALAKTLAKLDKITNYSPYNIAYIMAPKGAKGFRMSVRIMPRLAIWAGFEMGCGAVMNSIIPDIAAKMIADAKI